MISVLTLLSLVAHAGPQIDFHKNYFEILGVDPRVPIDSLREIYRTKLRQTENWVDRKNLKEAYEILSHLDLRGQYLELRPDLLPEVVQEVTPEEVPFFLRLLEDKIRVNESMNEYQARVFATQIEQLLNSSEVRQSDLAAKLHAHESAERIRHVLRARLIGNGISPASVPGLGPGMCGRAINEILQP